MISALQTIQEELDDGAELDSVRVVDPEEVLNRIQANTDSPRLKAEIEKIKTLPEEEQSEWILGGQRIGKLAGPVETCVVVIVVVVKVVVITWVVVEVWDAIKKVWKKQKQKKEEIKEVKEKKEVEVEADEDGTCPAEVDA